MQGNSLEFAHKHRPVINICNFLMPLKIFHETLLFRSITFFTHWRFILSIIFGFGVCLDFLQRFFFVSILLFLSDQIAIQSYHLFRNNGQFGKNCVLFFQVLQLLKRLYQNPNMVKKSFKLIANYIRTVTSVHT